MFLESSWIGGVRSGFSHHNDPWDASRLAGAGELRSGVWVSQAVWQFGRSLFLRGAWLFVLDDREEQDLGVGSFLVTFGVGGGDSHDSGI